MDFAAAGNAQENRSGIGSRFGRERKPGGSAGQQKSSWRDRAGSRARRHFGFAGSHRQTEQQTRSHAMSTQSVRLQQTLSELRALLSGANSGEDRRVLP